MGSLVSKGNHDKQQQREDSAGHHRCPLFCFHNAAAMGFCHAHRKEKEIEEVFSCDHRLKDNVSFIAAWNISDCSSSIIEDIKV